KNLWIACGGGTVLAIKELQPAGKGKQVIAEFLNGSGQHVEIGQQVK
ncbi:MAG TPA: methionyl-tRNA formyltransferase, partial [Enterococcus sp.]|nr:methionyl-tRNA formyltransferase [Enterococcus sp.]